MIKFKQGRISTMEGKGKDIIVKASHPNSLKDLAIGMFFIGLGVGHIAINAFKNGAKAHEDAELRTMQELGIIK